MLQVFQLQLIAVGLNIEGCLPARLVPEGCKWYNILQVIDEPLKGDTFDAVMKRVKDNNLKFIEEAVGIDIENLLNIYTLILNRIKERHKKVLVHVHQYQGTTELHKELNKRTGLEVILDETNFHEHPVNYREKYPDIDALVSLSQCAGFGHLPGTFIVPSSFLNFDVKNNVIDVQPKSVDNHIKEVLSEDLDFVEGKILVVNDLWNPKDLNESLSFHSI